MVRITERDLRLFRWISSHGFVDMDLITKWMNVHRSASYRRIKKLSDAKFLKRERILYGYSSIITVTNFGLAACGDTLPHIKKIPLGTLFHELKLINLALNLEAEHKGSFVPERVIRYEMGLRRDDGHIPDGILTLPDKTQIAIELELSIKSKKRLNDIMANYASNFDYKEVWYFVSSASIKTALEKAAEKQGASHVKFFMID